MPVSALSIPLQTETSQELQLPFIQRKNPSSFKDLRLAPESIANIFRDYIPPGAMDLLIVCLQGHSLECRLTKKRASKSGDFRPSVNNRPPRITINRDLNPFAFLLTLIHEVAHFFVYLDAEKRNLFLVRKRRPLPHGKEWKKRFTDLMHPFICLNIFPPEIEKALISYFENPKASASADARLHRLLQDIDPPGSHLRVSEIPENTYFRIPSGRLFLKLGKVRKRYKCICMKTRKVYLVSPDALVIPADMTGEEKLL